MKITTLLNGIFFMFLIIHKHKKVSYPFENFTMSLQVATSTENTYWKEENPVHQKSSKHTGPFVVD